MAPKAVTLREESELQAMMERLALEQEEVDGDTPEDSQTQCCSVVLLIVMMMMMQVAGCLGGDDHGNTVDDNDDDDRYDSDDDDDRYDSVRLCKILTLTRTVVTIAAVLSFNPFL